MKTIAIDFDGVLHKYSKGWQKGEIYDGPVEGAVDAFFALIDAGFNPVVFTTRDDLESVKQWMHKHFDFEKRMGNFYDPAVVNKKPLAFAYIDDRAIRFTNWSDTLKYFR